MEQHLIQAYDQKYDLICHELVGKAKQLEDEMQMRESRKYENTIVGLQNQQQSIPGYY